MLYKRSLLMETLISIIHTVLLIILSCASLSTSAINNLRSTYFLLARQEISLKNLPNATDSLTLSCRQEGIFPYTGSCAEYVLCRRQGTLMIIEHYRCSFGIFDTISQKCNWAKLSAPCQPGNVSRRNSDDEVLLQQQPVIGVSRLPGSSQRKSQLPLPPRPSSYVSELSGLTCKITGYFPHPTNNSKFYRCVELSPATFMVYLFSCESNLVYEPIVRACVKPLSEERMDTGDAYPLLTQTPSWVVERCRAQQTFPASGKPTTLFRNPINCRRFFRCSTTSVISLKIEQFSCPTGLFFDEDRKSCTWASETADCVSIVDELEVTSNMNPTSGAFKPTPPPRATFATVWVTMPRKVTRVTAPPGGGGVASTTTIPIISSDNEIRFVPKMPVKPADDRLFFGDISSVMGTDTDPNWLFKQALKPPPYLTATGILVTNPTEFQCTAPGTYPTSIPCIFYKCEKYSWVKNFLLFRFTCPPHTIFNNGTCEYNATVACANGDDTDASVTKYYVTNSTTDAGDIITTTLSPVKNQKERPRLLCKKDGTFPLPFATPCSTRFMVCRRLAGPLHFFVSVHECPPSLVFSVTVNQCVDPTSENLQCSVGSFDLSSLGDEETEPAAVTPDPLEDKVAVCTAAGFSKISCKRFRRCEWIPDAGQPSGTWISYDFECGRNMVFDETVVACVQQTGTVPCIDPPVAELPATVTANPIESTEKMDITPETDVTEPGSIETDTSDVAAVAVIDVSGDLTTPVPPWTLPGSASGDARDTSTSTGSSTTLQITSTESFSEFNQQTSAEASNEVTKFNQPPLVVPTNSPTTETMDAGKKGHSPICYRSGYFLYPDDSKCQRFYRCLQLTPEPNSFVMLHYRCDDGYVFDRRYFACSALDTAPPCVPATADSMLLDQTLSAVDSAGVAADPSLTSAAAAATDADRKTASVNALPVKILPQVWHMSNNNNDSTNTGALICTTQRIYRLQTCGYYYSCIETETKGQFHLQEIYCETLYLDISTGQCTPPPPNDPCNANSITRFSSIWSVRKPTRPMQDADTTTTTTTQSTTTLPSTTTTTTTTEPPTTTATTPETTSTTSLPTTTTPTPTTITPSFRRAVSNKRRRIPQVPAAIKIQGTKNTSDTSGPVFINPAGSPEYFTIPKNRVTSGVYSPVAQPLLQTNRYSAPGTPPQFAPLGSLSDLLSNNPGIKTSSDYQSLSAYRDSFNQLYSYMTGTGYPTTMTPTTTIPPALVLNFNTPSEQPVGEMVKAGVTFQCRSEGYFRNARDISCSKFYLCVKVGPRQYNLFEFMCLPHNGIQWKYHQERNACVEPTDVKEC
ncbi:mucin-5AC-like [Paramacrobiotus metropolitanus]|uniref:mucin-5AC-like n=1 Tax=Paramacrobiotus metropolitanus TaxID=2943436 RepID=UPI0024462367|nr:mucin-5AC-like [Paramacrobiotus metropolitanus]